jgi:hypothetical protein
MSRATDLFSAERERQVSHEGYDPKHDSGHEGELALAAESYALAAADDLGALRYVANNPNYPPFEWPWHEDYWKPTGDAKRDLIKAGALLAAALDSLLDSEEAAQTGAGE